MMNLAEIRNDFPYFSQQMLPVYLDQASTAQKPKVVVDRLTRFYVSENANIHRGDYLLARRATSMYEHARETVAAFIGASPHQVAFTLNATDSLNMAINLASRRGFGPGKNALTTAAEHHSAFLPLQVACKRTGTELRVIPLTDDGAVDMAALPDLVDENTVCAVLTLGANTTGWKLPLSQTLPLLERPGLTVIMDASQRIVHERMSMQMLGCDFLCFSGHKLYGPMGIGVLCMKEEWTHTAVVRYGGGMVDEVSENDFVRAPWAKALEAGTPPIPQALGLEAAIEYLGSLDYAQVQAHEKQLLMAMRHGLASIPGLRLIGCEQEDGLPIVAFVSNSIHAVDFCKLLELRGFALRCGRHCAHIYHARLGLSATLRASMGLYTSFEEVDAFLNAVEVIQLKWKHLR